MVDDRHVVFLGGLPASTNRKALTDVLEEAFGRVSSCRVITEKAGVKIRQGYGFATFTKLDAAIKARKAGRVEFERREVRIRIARNGLGGDENQREESEAVRQERETKTAQHEIVMTNLELELESLYARNFELGQKTPRFRTRCIGFASKVKVAEKWAKVHPDVKKALGLAVDSDCGELLKLKSAEFDMLSGNSRTMVKGLKKNLETTIPVKDVIQTLKKDVEAKRAKLPVHLCMRGYADSKTGSGAYAYFQSARDAVIEVERADKDTQKRWLWYAVTGYTRDVVRLDVDGISKDPKEGNAGTRDDSGQ
jgi:hypothetical protein